MMGSNQVLPFTALGFVAALMLAIVLHELGHYLLARIYRVPVKLIAVGIGPVLWRHSLGKEMQLVLRAFPVGVAVGVLGRRDGDGRERRPVTHDMAVAAGGPTASFVLALVLAVLAVLLVRADAALSYWLLATGLLSLLLALLNLVPMPGLDGGHLLLLGLARAGLQLSPNAEVRLHRMGVRVLLLACLGLWLARTARLI